MKILCIDQFSAIGGAQRSLLDLLPAFRERGWTPHVALPGDGGMTALLQQQGYPFHHFDCSDYAIVKKSVEEMARYAVEQPRLVRALAKLLRQETFDLLYVNGPRLLPSAAVLSWWSRTPLIFHCHNRLLQSSAAALARGALSLSRAHVIACCRFAAEPLRPPSSHKSQLSIVFNGVTDLGFRRRKKGAVRNLGVIGRIEEQKGQLDFVKAAQLVNSTVENCCFQIIGAPMFSNDSYYQSVARESRNLPLRMHGWTEDVATVFSELDMLIVPSKAVEATTRVILEAYSAGVPVVAFRSGGIPEVVQDGVTAFLVDEATPEALAARMIQVLGMSDVEIDSVVDNARAVWAEHFHLPGYQRKVCDVIDGVAQSKRTGAKFSAATPFVHTEAE